MSSAEIAGCRQTDRQTGRQRNARPKPRTTVVVVWRTDTDRHTTTRPAARTRTQAAAEIARCRAGAVLGPASQTGRQTITTQRTDGATIYGPTSLMLLKALPCWGRAGAVRRRTLCWRASRTMPHACACTNMRMCMHMHMHMHMQTSCRHIAAHGSCHAHATPCTVLSLRAVLITIYVYIQLNFKLCCFHRRRRALLSLVALSLKGKVDVGGPGWFRSPAARRT